MKYIQTLSSLMLGIAMQTAMADSAQLDYVKHAATQIAYVENQQQAVWPGFHPAHRPVLIHFIGEKEKSAYALNYQPGGLPWQQLNIADHPVYYLPDASALKLPAVDGMVSVEGQTSFMHVENPDTIKASENLANPLMVALATYYFTHEAPFDPAKASFSSLRYDRFTQPEFVKLVYLEDAALTAAQQTNPHNAEIALRDAVAIHQYRTQLASESDRQYENGHEVIVGTPVFIGWTSKQLSDDDYRKMSQRTGCVPLRSMFGASAIFACVNDSFPAFASSVYGHALSKKLSPAWQRQVEQQFKSISQLAVEYYHFTDEQAHLMTEQAMKNPDYHYRDRISTVVDHTLSSYLESAAMAQKKYAELSGVEVRMPAEIGNLFVIITLFVGSMNDSYKIDNQSALIEDLNVSVPFPNSPESLVFNHLPYLYMHTQAKGFSSEADDEYSYAAIRLTAAAELIIDDVKVSASEFVKNRKTQLFHKLVIVDSFVHLPFLESGKVNASDGILRIEGSDKLAHLAAQQPALVKQMLSKG